MPKRAVAWLCLILCACACSIEPPEAPSFETQVYLPLGVRRTTGLDLVGEDNYIEGDTSGATPLRFVRRGVVERMDAGSVLDLSLPAETYSFGLDSVRLTPERPFQLNITLRNLHEQFRQLPPDSQAIVIAPFTIEPVTLAVPPLQSFRWVRVRTGEVSITIGNHLPVPLGGPEGGGPPIRVQLRDRASGVVIAVHQIERAILPGGQDVIDVRLDDQEFSNDLLIDLQGSSSGSDGQVVTVLPDDQLIFVSARFGGLAADSVYATVPAQSAAYNGSVTLGDDVELSEGVIRDGTVRVEIENGYPLAGAVWMTFLSVQPAGGGSGPLVVRMDVPAGVAGAPGRAERAVVLAGCTIRPRDEARQALEYRLYFAADGSTEPVHVGSHDAARGLILPTSLRFDSIRGRMTRREFEITPSETAFDPPEGIDSLSFVSAELVLDVTSTIEFPASGQLRVVGVSGAGGRPFTLPLQFSIPGAGGGAPRATRTVFDETNSSILELIAARPRALRISGTIFVGDGGEGTIRRTDWTEAAYSLSAPLRMRIGRITHRADPTSFTISRDAQERIRENALSAAARGVIVNHFPAGLEMRLLFASTRSALALDPSLHPDSVMALEPVTVAAGETDPVTGRVTAARESPFASAIRPDQVSFFARDSLLVQAVLVIVGEDPARVVELTAHDYAEVNAMLSFRARVNP